MFKNSFLYTLLCSVLLAFVVQAASTKNVPNMPHVPLMTGLHVVDENDYEGYRVETEGDGALFADEVRAFYFHELQDLDWEYKGNGRFVRDEQQLSIQVSENNGHLKVLFYLHECN